jgi:hypothetical protein
MHLGSSNYLSIENFLTIKTSSSKGNQWFDFCDRISMKDASVCQPKPCSFPLNYVTFKSEVDQSYDLYIDTNYNSIDEKSCRLKNGSFRGHTEIKEGILYCIQDLSEEGIRIHDVQYRDINIGDFPHFCSFWIKNPT